MCVRERIAQRQQYSRPAVNKPKFLQTAVLPAATYFRSLIWATPRKERQHPAKPISLQAKLPRKSSTLPKANACDNRNPAFIAAVLQYSDRTMHGREKGATRACSRQRHR